MKTTSVVPAGSGLSAPYSRQPDVGRALVRDVTRSQRQVAEDLIRQDRKGLAFHAVEAQHSNRHSVGPFRRLVEDLRPLARRIGHGRRLVHSGVRVGAEHVAAAAAQAPRHYASCGERESRRNARCHRRTHGAGPAREEREPGDAGGRAGGRVHEQRGRLSPAAARAAQISGTGAIL